MASIASIPNIQHPHHQQQSLHTSDSQSLIANTIATTPTTPVQQVAQAALDPYTPTPNLIRVERIKDVNSGQDVFIRWVSDTNPTATQNDEQQTYLPKQAYSTQPPRQSSTNFDYQVNRELPSEIERIALEDEYLRKSLVFDDGPASVSSNYEQKKYKKRSKKEKYRDWDKPKIDYEVVDGFFEDHQGRRRSIKLDHARVNDIKDYRHSYNEVVNSAAPKNNRRRNHRAKSLVRPSIPDQQYQQHPQFPTPTFPIINQPMMRPFGTTFLPRGAPFYPQQTFHSTPLFTRPNFLNRAPLTHPSFWYRPM